MLPKWGQVRQFCEMQGYNKTETDHTHYIKPLPDRTSSDTMISHGKDSETVDASTWTRVWKHQLRLLSEADFWKGIEGKPVQYDIPPTPEAPQPLPDYLQRLLRDRLHLREDQISQLDRDEAQELVDSFFSQEVLND